MGTGQGDLASARGVRSCHSIAPWAGASSAMHPSNGDGDRSGRAVLFDQDRLAAYNLARAFTRDVGRVLRHIGRGQVDALDQLRRACLSITLNTAEGAGEFRPKEKARFYRMARRSGTEAAAVLDSFVDRGVLPESAIEPPRATLHRVIGDLTRLVLSCETTGAREPPAPSRGR